MNCHYLMPKMSGYIRVCFSHFLWIIATKRSSLILSILDIVSRGWDGISFTLLFAMSQQQVNNFFIDREALFDCYVVLIL